MEFLKAFPVAIIDEDYEGKSAAGIGMRQLAKAIEKEGLRVVAGVSYADAQRLVEVFNNESCWLVSVDGTEAGPKQWEILEEVLAKKRRRNDRLPIFLFGDQRTAEARAGKEVGAREDDFLVRLLDRGEVGILDVGAMAEVVAHQECGALIAERDGVRRRRRRFIPPLPEVRE